MQSFYNDILFYKLASQKFVPNLLPIDTADCNSVTVINSSPVGFIRVNGVTLSPNEIIKFEGRDREILFQQKVYVNWTPSALLNLQVTIIRKKFTNDTTKL
jgi:hypothetical protein